MHQPVIVILGLGRGVGVACARTFAENKWSVLVGDPNAKSVQKAKDDLEGLALVVHDNVFSKLGIHNCLAAALEAYEAVDFVLIIPPIPEPSSLLDVEMESLDASVQETMHATILAAQIFAPIMREQAIEDRENGRQSPCPRGFLQILSFSALSSDPGRGSEAITQGAALETMKGLAVDLARDQIRSNAIIALRPRAEEEEDWLKTRTPLKRSALADEIAETAVFLASTSSAIITGQSIVLDGGRSILNGVI